MEFGMNECARAFKKRRGGDLTRLEVSQEACLCNPAIYDVRLTSC
jgi:hypothetical protein